MSELAAREVRGVSLAYWAPSSEDPDSSTDPESSTDPAGNLGDILGPAIAAALAPSGEGAGTRLLSAGSVIHAARPSDIVWGAGLNLKLSRPIAAPARDLDYRAVRGPLTRAALTLAGASVPNVLGDPVSLLPDVFPEVREWVVPSRSITIVPNLNDLAAFADHPNVVSPLGDPWAIVRAIAESEFVVGSSLHAIIIAEALGIPARFQLSEVENPWKYHDYLLSTGRSKERFATSVDDAVDLGGYPPPQADLDELRSAFPIDLWGASPRPEPPEPWDPSDLFDHVVGLLSDEFDDVSDPRRGGHAMVRALTRMLAAPLVRSCGHRLRSERFDSAASAVQQLVGGRLDELGLEQDPGYEVLRMLSDGRRRIVPRVVLRDAAGPHTRVLAVDAVGDRFEWRFSGVGLGPTALNGATESRAVLLHDGHETPLPVSQLAVSVDYPDFRWSLSLRLADIPLGVSRFGLRIDWLAGSVWIPGARISRTPDVQAPEHLRLRGDDGWRLQSEAIAAREQPEYEQPVADSGPRNVRSSAEFSWLATPAVPRLSVVVTAHNVVEWLDETLFSILRQDVDTIEVILVDDHSSDEIDGVLDRFAGDRRLVVIDAIDRGGANARDVGAAVAAGTFIVFADGDDLVPDGAYRALLESLEQSGSDVAIGNFNKFSPSEIWRPTRRWGVFDEQRTHVNLRDAPDLIRGRAVWNKVFRREFWVETGVTFPEVPRSNDIVPMTRALLAAEHIDIVDRDVYLYRDRPGRSSMTSQSSSTAGLVSYLTQELECVRLIRADGDAGLLATMTALVVSADGWAHLERVACEGFGLPSTLPPLIDAILGELPPDVVSKQPGERQAAFRLLALGRLDAAEAILRHHGRDPGDEALVHLAGWLEAFEIVPELTSDHRTFRDWYRRNVGPALEAAGRLSASPEVAEQLRRAHEMAPSNSLDPIIAASLRFAVQADTPERFEGAMRMLGALPPSDPGAATLDDWLGLLDTDPRLSQKEIQLIWRDRIQPLIDAELQRGIDLPRHDWQRLVEGRRRALTAFNERGVRRAAPVVAIVDSFGTDVLPAYVALKTTGLVADRSELESERLGLSGSMPAEAATEEHLVLHVQRDGETVATFPVATALIDGRATWSTTIDLGRVPLDGSGTAVIEGFRGNEGWFYLRVPLAVTGRAVVQAGGHLWSEDGRSAASGAVVKVKGEPGASEPVAAEPAMGEDWRRQTVRVARAVRRRLRRLRQALFS